MRRVTCLWRAGLPVGTLAIALAITLAATPGCGGNESGAQGPTATAALAEVTQGQQIPLAADATPTPGVTPDKTKPQWYAPYLELEKTMPKFSGEINGIALGQPDGPVPQCSQTQMDPGWEDALRGTAFDLNLDALPAGVRLSGTPRVGRCADDGRVMWVIASLEVSAGPGVDGDRGIVQVSRWEAVRWYSQQYLAERVSADTVAGRPAVLADAGPSGIGQRAVLVADAETGGSTALLSSNVELALLKSVAALLYR